MMDSIFALRRARVAPRDNSHDEIDGHLSRDLFAQCMVQKRIASGSV